MNIRRIALSAALLACGVAIGVGPAAQAADPTPDEWNELYLPYFNPGQFKCLDVPGGTNDIGAQLQVFHCHGYASNGAPQRWALLNRGRDGAGDIMWEIMNLGSRACLNVAGGSGATGTRAVQDICRGTTAGLWVLHATPNVGPYYGLSNVRFPNQCLAASNSSGGDRTRVEIAGCNYFNQSDPTWIRQVWGLG